MKQKILIFFSLGIGDSLMVTPVLKSLMAHKESFEIDALVMNKASYNILKESEYFSQIHYVPFQNKPITSSIKKVLEIRKKKYDKSFLIFPSNLYKYRMVHYLIGAKERYSHDYIKKSLINLDFLSNKRIKEDRTLHSVEENYALFEYGLSVKLDRIKSMEFSIPKDKEVFADNYLKEKGIKGDIIGIHAGSDILKNHINRRWPLEYFGEFIKMIHKKHDCSFMIFGGPIEYELNDKIKEYLPNESFVIKDTSFIESAALIKKCMMFISNDSGLMHTASALKVPVLALFGPTNPVYVRPYGTEYEIAAMNYPCQPCFEYSPSPLICSQKDKYKCVKNLKPGFVIGKFNDLYNRIKKQEEFSNEDFSS